MVARKFEEIATIPALVDSGATGVFLHKNTAVKYNLPVFKLKRPITAVNADGTINRNGVITQGAWVEVKIGNLIQAIRMLIADTGEHALILGTTWLEENNPQIDWQKRIIEVPDKWEPEAMKKALEARQKEYEELQEDPGPIRIQAVTETEDKA